MSDLLNGKHYCRTATPDANGLRSECGSVTTMSGDVRCGKISGSVSTMSGDIISR